MSQSRSSLLRLYKQLLRACETYPSKKRGSMYQAIRDEWRDHQQQSDEKKIHQQISIAYKGLSQLQQFSIQTMTSGEGESSPNWNVTLEQNPMPKPVDYEERKRKRKEEENKLKQQYFERSD